MAYTKVFAELAKPTLSFLSKATYLPEAINFATAARSSSAIASGAVGLQCAHTPVSEDAMNCCLSAERMGVTLDAAYYKICMTLT